jgi:hypothetical protein
MLMSICLLLLRQANARPDRITGAQLMKKMGWNQGEGLGKKGGNGACLALDFSCPLPPHV